MSAGFVLALVALSATPITLGEARQEGRSSTSALLAELERLRAEAATAQARSALLPQVQARFSAGGAYSGPQRYLQNVPAVDQAGNLYWRLQAIDVDPVQRGSFDLSVTLNQLIYDGGRWAQLAQSGAQAEAARGQAEEERSAAELEAIRRFYDLLRAQRILVLLDERAASSQQLLERASSLYQAGRVKKEDEIAARVNLGNDRISVLRQRAALTGSQANLAVWLARPPGEPLRAEDPGTLTGQVQALPTLAQALEVARQRRPLVRAYDAQLRAARAGVDAAMAGFFPSFSGYVQYGRQGASPNPFFTDITRQNTVSGGVALSWDLFSGFGTQAQVSQARALLSRAELQLQQVDRDIQGELQRALAALDAMVQIAVLAEANLTQAQDGLVLARSRFEAGDASTLEVRDAQVKLTQAEVSLLESRIDVEIARATLERAMGTLSPGAEP